MTDLRAAYEAQRAELEAAALRVLRSGWYVLGEEVAAFEREFALHSGAGHCVGVANGTDAVELALRASGVGEGDVVFTVSHTAVATVVGVERAGALPAFVDVDPHTMTMDAQALQAAVVRLRDQHPGLRPRAVLPVHLYGRPAAMPGILDVAAAEELLVVEDCAQAHGASLGGQAVGTFGQAAAYSFYPTKNLGGFGDGGAVVTSSAETDDRLRRLRQYGWRERYVSDEPGINSRLDEMQAALLRVRLSRLELENEQRRAHAARYSEGLSGSGLLLPAEAEPDSVHAFHQYVIRFEHRDALQRALRERGIGTAVLYPVPVHLQPAYRKGLTADWPLVHTVRAAAEVLALPMSPHLDDGDVDRVIDAARQAVAALR